MNTILFLFIFPISVIIFSVALQKLLKKPFLVAAIIFAIFLIITFTIYGSSFLIYAFIYGLISLITADITCVLEQVSNKTIQINVIENEENNTCNRCAMCKNRNCEETRDDYNYNEYNLENNSDACKICCCQKQYRRCLRGK